MKPASSTTALAAAPAAVPLLDLRRQYETIREDVLAAITRVCDSQGFILGPEVDALEREIAALTGASGAVGCASGTEALWLALVAAGVKPGDSVITTPFSFFASASAIVRAGATPVFVDVDPGTLNLDAALVRNSVGRNSIVRNSAVRNSIPAKRHENLRAVLPVHLYGQCADMDAFNQLGEEFDLAIVEDAAQAIGAEWHGRGAGSLGVTAAFSFYPTKNLSAYGDAGIVTTNDLEMAEHMRRLRNHGSPRRYYHEEFGWNGRIDAIQAAVLRVKLVHLGDWNRSRQQHAATYDRLFAEAGLTSQGSSNVLSKNVSSEDGSSKDGSSKDGSSKNRSPKNRSANAGQSPVRLLARTPEATHVFHQYVIRAARRDELRAFLAERKIGSEVYYPLPLHLQPAFSYLGLREGDLPVAEQAARDVLALPMFAELTEAEIRRVVETIADFYS